MSLTYADAGSNPNIVGTNDDDNRTVLVHKTNADYLKSLGIQIRQGRSYDETEVASQK